MDNHDFLVEIGLEEMPARFVQAARDQLQDKVQNWMDKMQISYSKVQAFATARRLAVLVEDVEGRQQDRAEVTRGPARKIALDEDGNWTKAAQGFARSQGVSTEELFFREHKNEEYLYAQKEIRGKDTLELLPQMQEVIHTLSYPKNMRWGEYELRFVRPIRWLVALYGSNVIPFEIAGVRTGNQSQGHRFLGTSVTITKPGQYEQLMMDQYVLVSMGRRKKTVLNQLQQLEEEHQWAIPVDPDLLDEVIQLVEYPTAIYGTFASEFLSIPEEILITTMKEHQRYFPVRNKDDQLLPYFITIRNGKEDQQGIVARGNEKVLRARLADARFFYEEDQKISIDSALSQLESVVFHEELGTMGDKIRRIREMTAQLAEWLDVDPEAATRLNRSAEICKFDLVTQMVDEFPKLQGRMGAQYARLAGEEEEISQAIYEHYLPRFSGDQLPHTVEGAILSVADKMDTIVGCFSIGIVPTGSQDPYALRRQAAGIIDIILDQKWDITLDQLFRMSIYTLKNRQLMKRNAEQVRFDLEDFFHLRLKNRLQEAHIRYDIIDSLLTDHLSGLPSILAKAHVLMQQAQNPAFKLVVESFTRVHNLAQKMDGHPKTIDPHLFAENTEQELYDVFQQVKENVNQLHAERNWQGVYHELTRLRKPIDRFFEQVMVMAEDDQLRANRLSLLQHISTFVGRYADFTQVVFGGKSD